MAPDAAPDGLGQRRLYPRLKVVTEDYERDCYLVTPSRAAASKSFELLAAFRKAGGEWMPGRTASRLRARSVEFGADRPSGSKTRRTPKAEVDPELAIRPLTVAQATPSRVAGSAAQFPSSLTMSLSRSDSRRPPTGVRGRTKESKRVRRLEEQGPEVQPVFGNLSKTLEESLHGCSYPGAATTLVMKRSEGSMRHPETYAQWLVGLRHVMEEMDAPAENAKYSLASGHSRARQFREKLGTLSREVLAAVQLQLDYVRSEVAGLCAGGAVHVVGGASAVEGFAAKYGQRRLELAMLRKHLLDQHWNIHETRDLDCSAGAQGFTVWINGLTIQRFSLRHNAQVQRAILSFFNAMKNPLGQVAKQTYITFNVKVFRALLPVFDIDDATLLSEADWVIDSHSATKDSEKLFIDEQQFCNSVFELADNWCEYPTVTQMVMWLNKLRIALFDREGAFLSDDDIVHDERFWFDDIDPLRPSIADQLQSLETRGTRNVMFQYIREQMAQQETQTRRAALSASRPRSLKPKTDYSSIGPRNESSAPPRPRTRESFNIKVGGKRLSLAQTEGDVSPLRSYLNDVRIPNVWAAELKEIAAAYLRQAEREHANAAALEQESQAYAHPEDAEGWMEDDQDPESQAPAEVYAFPEQDSAGDFQEPGCDMDSDGILRFLGTDEQEVDGPAYDGDGHDYETGLVLSSEIFADGEQVGDVGKLRQLHSIIYGRAQTPAEVNGVRTKLGLFNERTSDQESPQEMERREQWAKHYRWAHVNKPSRKEWERFKAARFKEREMAYNRMRSERSRALESYYDDQKALSLNLKSFAERWEEREDKRRLATLDKFKAKSLRSKKKLSAFVEKKLAEISDVIHGFQKGTFHGATPGSRGESAEFTSTSATPGLEFPAQDVDEVPEPTIDVSKIVEARLLRIGIADPNSISQLRRSSRPGTSMSNSLALIDETRAGIVDEPVLGWSSGLPAPIGTPSNDNGGYLTPLDSASLSNTWKRVPTPNTPDKPSPFSPMLQSAGAAVPFSPALAPLKEGKESHVRKENLPSDVRMMSRESVRQRKSTAGSALDSISERLGIKTPGSRGNTASGNAVDVDGIGVWGDDRSEGMSGDANQVKSKQRRKRSGALDTSPEGLQNYVSRTQSEQFFAEKQQQFHDDWEAFRELKAEVDGGESSDDALEEPYLPTLVGRKQGTPGRRTSKSRGGK